MHKRLPMDKIALMFLSIVKLWMTKNSCGDSYFSFKIPHDLVMHPSLLVPTLNVNSTILHHGAKKPHSTQSSM